MERHRKIEDEAARWLVRRDAGDWSDADRAELTQWLEASSAHMVAFVRLESTWQRVDRLKSLGAGVDRGVVPSPDDWQLAPAFDDTHQIPRKSRTRPFVKYGLAASVCLAFVAAIVVYLGQAQNVPTYQTPIGGIASVPVADGSRITLDTDSEVRVALTRSERDVRLERGEAFFEVAKDANRPFVVSAAGHRVVAVGTAFSVRSNPDGSVRIAVIEGRVRIEAESAVGARVPVPEFASAGNVALARTDGIDLQRKSVTEVEEMLSWRSGFLIFHDVSLPDAVAEFNRYNTRKIEVADPRLGEIKLSGKFQTTQYQAFVRLLEEGSSLRAVHYDDRVVLTSR
jgi:transmembrane sensor